jgi:hypothetical protein
MPKMCLLASDPLLNKSLVHGRSTTSSYTHSISEDSSDTYASFNKLKRKRSATENLVNEPPTKRAVIGEHLSNFPKLHQKLSLTERLNHWFATIDEAAKPKSRKRK